MMMAWSRIQSMPLLKIETDQLALTVSKGESLQDICTGHSTSVLFGCFSARCGICRIKVLENPQGLSPVEEMEADLLSLLSADPDERLACQCKVLDDVTIVVSQVR
jgi:ferredoxin